MAIDQKDPAVCGCNSQRFFIHEDGVVCAKCGQEYEVPQVDPDEMTPGDQVKAAIGAALAVDKRPF